MWGTPLRPIPFKTKSFHLKSFSCKDMGATQRDDDEAEEQMNRVKLLCSSGEWLL